MTIYSTIWTTDPTFNASVHVIDWRVLGWRGVSKALAAAGGGDVIVVNGALGYPERWRDLVLASWRARGRVDCPGFVVADATWEPRSARSESKARSLWTLNSWFNKVLVRHLARRRTTFCFLSTLEVSHFLVQTGLPPSKAVYTPFLSTLFDAEWQLISAARRSRIGVRPYVFTGGNTLRDWPLLIDALANCGAPVKVATSHTTGCWPDNFEVGPVPHDDFLRIAAGASVGVLALRSDVARSAGQQTYLNMLRLGVPVVVNDAPGVRDHLDGVPGAFITPNDDPVAMGKKVRWLLDPSNAAERDRLIDAGAADVGVRFGEAAYFAKLVDVARGLATRSVRS